MFNLIGTAKKLPKLKVSEDIYLHWYGKSENRIGRKMGHINANSSSPNKALNKVKKASKEIIL